ncbi:pyridoxal 5'-phosphate synthase [Arthrobacter sp. NamB2]|uniref:pyridoxine/pyridoxamine 5'-phosphate oxidase n=1 Tax=Arthrobacter sp. NamB2 TaxID=2576035 RepID=UPI0010CA057B|nr:pyridoxal 5'-phosphate synthase [Arthrobacter sp. NamB2]TKV29193.1 pyridoxal 5'-phosphate synthase [Arthrobacter sp. NamB2]
MSEPRQIRDIVRGVPVFPDEMPPFDPGAAPASPIALFIEWLERAVEAGIAAPHAVNLSTVGDDGAPDARVVILKDVVETGWQVASSSDSPKGRQLTARPAAALTFFWPAAGRQVRVRGAVSTGSTQENDADFQRRHPVARALVLAGTQSSVVRGRDDIDTAVAEQVRRIEATDGLTSTTWTVFTIAPDAVEFWQADHERRHTRLLYTRFGEGWRREILWP